jgi:hypothetical protein
MARLIPSDIGRLELAGGRRLVCGMTRTTVKVDLVVRAGNPHNARFLEA